MEENLLIRNLENTGILERIENTLWIYPDLLGEYIFNDVFFGDRSILDIEDVFKQIQSSKLESILKTLRGLNNEKSNNFLNKISQELAEAIKERNNDKRIRLLELLEIIAYNVPDQAFGIVKSLFESEEISPKKYESPFPLKGREHIDVLVKCLDILNIIKYDCFEDVVEILARLYFYKKNDKNYDKLREKTLEDLLELCKYDFFEIRRYGYFFKKQLFKIITKWRAQNLQNYWIFITKLSKDLLSPEVEYHHTSPLDPMKFHFGRGPVFVNSDLIKLRKDILACLRDIFNQVDNNQQKIEILESIFEAARYPVHTELESDVERMIFENRKEIVKFLSSIVEKGQSPVIKQHIERKAVFMKRTERREFQELDILIRKIRGDAFYDLYRTFVGRELDYSIDDSEDWKEVIKKRVEKLNVIMSKINEENFQYWFSLLDRIAATYQEGKDFEFYHFRQFCFTIGKKKSKVAKKIIEVSIEKDSSIKNFVSSLLGGIKSSSEGEIADGFIENWINTEKIDLILKIPEVYSWSDEECLKKRDVNIFKKLSDYPLEDKEQRIKLDQKIMANISCVYKNDPKTAIRIIINLLKRAAPEYLEIYGHYLEMAHIRKEIDITKWNDNELCALINEFIKIPRLSHENIGILAIYGKRHPLKLIDFFEERVKKKNSMKDKFFDEYDAIPHHLDDISDMYRAHPEYLKVIKEILKWMGKGEWIYRSEGTSLILGISKYLDEKLEKVLEDYISSGRKEKILVAVKILNNYSQMHIVSYELLKKAILKSEGDKEILDAVSIAISQTGVVGGENGFINEYERKIKSIEDWKNDEDEVVREFAKKSINSFKREIEEERKKIKERKIRLKKGIF